MVLLPEITDTIDIDVTVSLQDLEDRVYEIFSKLFKDVKKEDLQFEELKGGYVNSIQRVFQKNEKSKSLVFRTFGMKLNAEAFNKSLKDAQAELDLKADKNPESKDDKSAADQEAPQAQPALDINTMFFNRETEFKVMNKVSKYGLCKPVYAKYLNGICYGYTEGCTCNGALMLTNDFLNEMAPKLAKFHSIEHEIDNIQFKTHFDRMQSQMGPMRQHMINAVDLFLEGQNEFPCNVFPKLSGLAFIEEDILNLLTQIGKGEIVFCHNDLNQKNIIWNAQNRTLGFIDFEMSMNNYLVFEIGQLFFCFCGHFLVDFNHDFFPNADYRKRFLRKYLEEKNRLSKTKMENDEFETKLEKLFHQVSVSTLYFMVQVIIMTPFFEINPELFKNEELDKSQKEIKHYCIKYGYKIFQLFNEIKDEIMESARKYLAENS